MKLFYLNIFYWRTSLGPSSLSYPLRKATDTFRTRVAKLIYVPTNTNLQFSIWPVPAAPGPSPNFGIANLELFATSATQNTGTTFPIIGSDFITQATYFSQNGWTDTGLRATWNQNGLTKLPSGFYVVIVTAPTGFNPVQISFSSDPYVCPYQSGFPDTY